MSTSVFPLDKDRQVIAEYSDPDGYIHKVLRLWAPEGDWIDIEVIEKFPGQEVLKSTLLNENNRIVAESRDKDGYINKIMLSQGPDIKEYLITKKMPTQPLVDEERK